MRKNDKGHDKMGTLYIVLHFYGVRFSSQITVKTFKTSTTCKKPED